MNDEAVLAFARLFNGRTDCYGSWEGGCVKQKLTIEHYRRHLTTGPYIGVYPTVADKATWGCVDIDGKDHGHNFDAMLTIAKNLRTVLSVKGVQAWIERSANGFHVWVFPDRIVPAADMRRCLQAACKVINYAPKEVNPKQERLDAGQVGNYVRLPYPGGWRATERRFISEPQPARQGAYELGQFLIDIDRNGRTPSANIAAVAKLWTPPEVQAHKFDDAAGLEVENLVPLLSGLAYTIWRDGCLPGKDRSTTLMRLAHLLAEDGWKPGAMLAVLKSADERMGGKFTSRGERGVVYLQDMVDRALAERSS